MTKYQNCCALVMCLCTYSIMSFSKDTEPTAKPVTGVADLQLKQDEIARLVPEALSGSGDAALRLSQYYGFVRLDIKAKEFWSRIGAEDGNAVSMYNYALSLYQLGELIDKSKGPTEDDVTRAIYWAKRAAAQGDDAAKKFLEDHSGK